MEAQEGILARLRPNHLGPLLWLTAGLEGYILATDAFLRAADPAHAFALAIFIGVDVALASLLVAGGEIPLRLTLLWAVVQLVGLLLNPFTGPQVGMDPATFARYLFGTWAYDAIVALRIGQVAVGFILASRWVTGTARWFSLRARRAMVAMGGHR